MKALSSESPQRRTRRISKPLMEKRRRERINHSLETLRLLMLENSSDEKLKNPKVEKAEILESVVHFLKTRKDAEKGQRAVKSVPSREQTPSCGRRQHNYRDGMRSCLLRVSHFIASKSQELEEAGALPEPQTHPASPGHIHRALMPSPAADSAALSPQHLPHHHHQHGITHAYLTHMTGLHHDTRELLSSTAALTHITDPVWRPWPQ